MMPWYEDTIFLVIVVFPLALFLAGGILGWLIQRFWVGGVLGFVVAIAFLLLAANETFLIWVVIYSLVGAAGSGLGWGARWLAGKRAV
ncbi:MAG: DUF2651 family protein [Chloroflexi bacterium]|nr:DUF2651 family protein [Chloroflexota bacterium]